MTFVFEGANLVLFLTAFGLALLVAMSEFSAPNVSLRGSTKPCPKHPGVAQCICRGDDFTRRHK